MAKAQVGDLIRVVNAYDEDYKNGEILEVARQWADLGVYVTKEHDDGDNMQLYDDEYEIHRKAGEEDAPKTPYSPLIAFGESEIQRHEESKVDAVNSPNHYTQGRFETIEIIEEITQGYPDGYVAYCVGNALKYLARAPYKHGEPTEDIGKAAKYLSFALERLQTQK